MATQVNMINALTGATAKTYDGFSWTMLFWGFLAPMVRGDMKMALISFCVIIFSAGIGGLILPFFWNKYHREALEQSGYITVEQYEHRKKAEKEERDTARREDREFMVSMKAI